MKSNETKTRSMTDWYYCYFIATHLIFAFVPASLFAFYTSSTLLVVVFPLYFYVYAYSRLPYKIKKMLTGLRGKQGRRARLYILSTTAILAIGRKGPRKQRPLTGRRAHRQFERAAAEAGQ